MKLFKNTFVVAIFFFMSLAASEKALAQDRWRTTGDIAMTAAIYGVLPNGERQLLSADFTAEDPVIAVGFPYQRFEVEPKAKTADTRVGKDGFDMATFEVSRRTVTTDGRGKERLDREPRRVNRRSNGDVYFVIPTEEVGVDICDLGYEARIKAGREYTRINLAFGLGPTFARNGTAQGSHGAYVYGVKYPWVGDANIKRYFEWRKYMRVWFSEYGRVSYTPEEVVTKVDRICGASSGTSIAATTTHATQTAQTTGTETPGGYDISAEDVPGTTATDTVRVPLANNLASNFAQMVSIQDTPNGAFILKNCRQSLGIYFVIKTQEDLSRFKYLRRVKSREQALIGWGLILKPGESAKVPDRFKGCLEFYSQRSDGKWEPLKR